MQEAIGYAAVTETPIVIVDVQRGGPSTGQPTLSGQQDIYQARYGSHGDYEIIVIAPSSVQEMYDFTRRAFELSEEYRTPVIILADEIVGHMREKITIHLHAEDEVIPHGSPHPIKCHSPSADFFSGANVLVEGQLHDELGCRIGHIPRDSGEFIRKINEKITDNIEAISDVETFFMEDAEIAIISYGSVARAAMNAVHLARGVQSHRRKKKGSFFSDLFHKGIASVIPADYCGLRVGLIKVNTVWPFPEDGIRRLTESADIVVVPEMNMGRYFREIERVLPGKRVISMPKCGGEIHSPHEILDLILSEVGAPNPQEEACDDE
jgi:2-oxoglutarate ferredoxin oxidoreductase subunit alpha